MNRQTIIGLFFLTCCFSFAHADEQTDDTTPSDVSTFIERREACEHFLGEVPGDQSERAREVNEKLEQYCPGNDKKLEELRSNYRNSPTVIQRLSKYKPIGK